VAISYVNSTIKCEINTVAGTAQAGTAPAGVAAGDWLIICASASVGTLPVWSSTTFTGWTTQLSLSETAMITLFLWRIADGSGTDTPPTISTNAAAHRVTVVGCYRGVDNASPLIASNGQVAAATQTVQATPSITNTDAAAWAVYIGTARQVVSPLTWSATAGNLVTAERQDADTGLTASTNNTAGTLYDSNGVVATGAATLSATTSATTPQSTVWGAFLKPSSATPTVTKQIDFATTNRARFRASVY
jgi:hypothetical protein